MKRIIIIEFFLIISLAISIYFNYYFWNSVKDLKAIIESYSNSVGYDYTSVLQELNQSVKAATINGTLTSTLSLLISIAMLLVALLNLSIFQPLRDKLAARKQARKEVKAQKAEANKQARIEALQNELDQLKKDE